MGIFYAGICPVIQDKQDLFFFLSIEEEDLFPEGTFLLCFQGQIMEAQVTYSLFVIVCIPAAVKNQKALFRQYFAHNRIRDLICALS